MDGYVSTVTGNRTITPTSAGSLSAMPYAIYEQFTLATIGLASSRGRQRDSAKLADSLRSRRKDGPGRYEVGPSSVEYSERNQLDEDDGVANCGGNGRNHISNHVATADEIVRSLHTARDRFTRDGIEQDRACPRGHRAHRGTQNVVMGSRRDDRLRDFARSIGKGGPHRTIPYGHRHRNYQWRA